jgi:hypothetical protein
MRFANRYELFVYQGDAPHCNCEQYAAGYDTTFETVLFLETMATTFCRLRPEALHRHGLPLQLRLLPTTIEVWYLMLGIFSADALS